MSPVYIFTHHFTFTHRLTNSTSNFTITGTLTNFTSHNLYVPLIRPRLISPLHSSLVHPTCYLTVTRPPHCPPPRFHHLYTTPLSTSRSHFTFTRPLSISMSHFTVIISLIGAGFQQGRCVVDHLTFTCLLVHIHVSFNMYTSLAHIHVLFHLYTHLVSTSMFQRSQLSGNNR